MSSTRINEDTSDEDRVCYMSGIDMLVKIVRNLTYTGSECSFNVMMKICGGFTLFELVYVTVCHSNLDN